jgi:hypothetical protein
MSTPNRKIKSTLALAVALGTLAPAAASARSLPPDPPGWSDSTASTAGAQPYLLHGTHDVGITSQQTKPYVLHGTHDVGITSQQTKRSPTQIVELPPSGFDWGDAGIGAAGGLGLSMLAAGGLALAQRRGRRAHGATSATR